MIDTTFDLFVDLGATDEQCDFPVVYASGANGIAGDAPETLAETLEPLFECIVREARLCRSFLLRPCRSSSAPEHPSRMSNETLAGFRLAFVT